MDFKILRQLVSNVETAINDPDLENKIDKRFTKTDYLNDLIMNVFDEIHNLDNENERLLDANRPQKGEVGMKLSEYSPGYIDIDVCDTEVDMLTCFVLDSESEPDEQDMFLSYLADHVVVTDEFSEFGNPELICDFSGFFKTKKDVLLDFYHKHEWIIDEEFDESEIYYDFVCNVLPGLIAGYQTPSTYKDLLAKLKESDEKSNVNTIAGDDKRYIKKEEMLSVLDSVFSDYIDDLHPDSEKNDKDRITDAGNTYKYVKHLVERENQRYTIISMETADDGYTYAVGYNENAPSPYVVWGASLKADGSYSFANGRYTDSLYDAVKTQAELTGLKNLKNDMFDTVNMTLLLNKYYDDALSKEAFRSSDVTDFVNSCVKSFRKWDKTLDDDIRDVHTIDSMGDFIYEDYEVQEFFDYMVADDSKGSEL